MGTYDSFFGQRPAQFFYPVPETAAQNIAIPAASPAPVSGGNGGDGGGRVRISTRNLLHGRVISITPGAVNSIVTVEVCSGQNITAVVTLDSLRDLGITVGSMVTVVINANDVLLLR